MGIWTQSPKYEICLLLLLSIILNQYNSETRELKNTNQSKKPNKDGGDEYEIGDCYYEINKLWRKRQVKHENCLIGKFHEQEMPIFIPCL